MRYGILGHKGLMRNIWDNMELSEANGGHREDKVKPKVGAHVGSKSVIGSRRESQGLLGYLRL